MLCEAGYYTGFIGKFGIGSAYPEGGFDFMRAFNGQGRYEMHRADGVPVHVTQLNGEHAIEFLHKRDCHKPFCLQVSFKAAHAQDGDPRQFIYGKKYENLYKDDHIPLPPGVDPDGFAEFPDFFRNNDEGRSRWKVRFSGQETLQHMIKGYYRLITGIDDVAGNVLSKLDAQRELGNTIVIYTSDNGFNLGEHGLAGKWFGHEPSIRVPMILADLRRPRLDGGKFASNLVLNIDIAPTLLSLAGLMPSPYMQGRDLSIFLGNDGVVREWRQDFFYEHLFEHPGIPKCEGVVEKKLKYMRYWKGEEVYEELFDLQNDPLELDNLVKKGGILVDKVSAFRQRMQFLRGKLQ